ncbi:MAG TPA: M48 family metallopeptidase, partial [Nitrosopumilaceae archaeon]|nr:M48 family metallopeptidase [Nitrosopumilaceae archaeon]
MVQFKGLFSMNNFSSMFLSGVLTVSCMLSAIEPQGRYYAELIALKNAPDAKIMFDEDSHEGLATIQRDINISKNLTPFQRFVRSAFIALDVVVVTPDTMPLLYSYVDGICQEANIATPTVFISRKDGFFNAFAQKLLMSTGGIIVGQKLMKEVSDDALEAIVAHEIGHIKHNHINKMLALHVVSFILFRMIANQSNAGANFVHQMDHDWARGRYINWYCKYKLVMEPVLSTFESFVINKRFEKEADAFACDNGKASGLIELFELFLKKDQLREEEFVTVYELLQKNKADLSTNDYYSLIANYYLFRAGQSFTNFFKKIYHETF